jgi:maltose O-acetyltransferase
VDVEEQGGMRRRMVAGERYRGDDPELVADRSRAQRLLLRFNQLTEADREERRALLTELLGHLGPGAEVMPSLRCDYGYNISLGEGVFINFDAVLLDVAPITVGAHCQLAPRVQLLTATHPIDPDVRRTMWEWGEPIVLGADVWLGGGVIVLPGVTIGAGTVVGAGAVVTRDLPERVVAVGNPARVLRPIGPEDR